MNKYLFLFTVLILPFSALAQIKQVPSDHVLNDQELIELLDLNYSPELKTIHSNYTNGNKDVALGQLAHYFKEKFSERYFFSWKEFDKKFAEYNQMYSGRKSNHQKNANQHLELYPATVEWKMPFKNKNNENVEAYPYRHLARQEKAKDIALMYYYLHDISYLNYIPEQAKSLNEAFNKGIVETIEDDNGAYEALIAGKRIFNWLFAHQIFLASDQYTWQQQLEMIKTFLHTAAQIEVHNQKYKEGNHQTLGVSSLSLLAILFPEIHGSDIWMKTAMNRLEEHLTKEIYPDGFQFERTIHYHIADIENYFYPWQLAQINKIELGPLWNQRMKGMFDVLVQMATPAKTLPVLQDDTNSPWAEYNEMGEIMALGAAIYKDPSWSYFASSKVSPTMYWLLTGEQLLALKSTKKQKPTIGSAELPQTGYYVMRQGWNDEDKYMVISAGLTPEKPDHQHGDMLGIQAYAYGNYILPNYMVRYSLPDLEQFKNSWVKNVFTVDSIPQGIGWNKNSSGFGKWNFLPKSEVLAWYKSDVFDYFAGKHNGYQKVGVETYRQVFYLKDDFWLIKDQFVSESEHRYQQIWQGHYSIEAQNRHIRSVFPNGAGLDIIQLKDPSDRIGQSSVRGKGMSYFEKDGENGQVFTTILFPFRNFDESILNEDYAKIKGWNIKYDLNPNENFIKDFSTDASILIYKNKQFLLLDASKLKIRNVQIELIHSKSDIWIAKGDGYFTLLNTGITEFSFSQNGQIKKLHPGEEIRIEVN